MSRISSELIRVYVGITRLPPLFKNSLVCPFFSFLYLFSFFTRTPGVNRASRRKNNLHMPGAVRFVNSRVVVSAPPYTLWILMARFVFTTRGWIFHRCERRKGDGSSRRSRRTPATRKWPMTTWPLLRWVTYIGVCISNPWTLTEDRCRRINLLV